jgi:Uma2 family endonuclease
MAFDFSPRDAYISNAEYLAVEERTGIRHEWFNGRVYAMAGAAPDHNTAVLNIGTSLNVQLRGRPCRPWATDQRVKIAATDLKTYPDVLVACPPHEWDEELPHPLLNPSVIIEVPSTAAYDWGETFDHYRRLPSLTDYLLVWTERVHVDHYRRQENNDWLLHIAESLEETLYLEGVGCRLSLAEIYERIEFGDTSQAR